MDDPPSTPGDVEAVLDAIEATFGLPASQPPPKRCSRCRKVKPRSAFHKDASRPDGYHAWCRDCRAATRDLQAERRRDRANRDSRRASHRRYYAANRETLQEAHRRWLADNREYALAAGRDSNRARYREQRAAVFAHYGWACACCGTTEQPTIDHVNGDGKAHRLELHGRSQGGPGFYAWLIREGFPEGFQTLCKPCNASKGRAERCCLDHDQQKEAV